MRITFVLPYAGLAGGIKVVAIYARLLREMGHHVNVVSISRSLSTKQQLRSLVREKKWLFRSESHGPSHFSIEDPFWTCYGHQGPIKNKHVPDADIIIATWWRTAEWVDQLDLRKGLKIYLCQGYEAHNFRHQKRAEGTYRMPLTQICVSQWVRRKIGDLTGTYNQSVVLNGVDVQQFYPSVTVRRDANCFGFMYSEAKVKGADIIVRALVQAKAMYPSIRAVAFGSRPPTGIVDLPAWIEFHHNPPQESLRDIYSECIAWLFGSRAEGFGLPILEAMACKTPVIGSSTGAATDLISERCGYLIPTEDPDAMAQRIVSFVEMGTDEWVRKSEAAYQIACSNDWNSSATELEELLFRTLKDHQIQT